MIRPKHVIFAGIFAMMAYVLVHNERFLVEPAHPVWERFTKYGWWLALHGLPGAAAMIAAPFQFSDRLRSRYPRWHRVAGYVYVFGILALAPLGVYVQHLAEARLGDPRSFTVLAATNAVLLYVTTIPAVAFARQRRLTLHRQWMTRSYAVALVFFQGRLILGVTGLETASVDMVEAVIWVCIAMAVPLADIINDWPGLRALVGVPRGASLKTGPAAPRAAETAP
jgi:uncharacterized membrane protein